MATLDERMVQGGQAREILESPVFNEAFDAVEKEILDKWKNSPARDQEGREKLWLMLSMLQKAKQALVQTMESGKLASLDVAHQQTLKDRARAWFGQSL